MNREELIAKLGTKEDGKFPLCDLEELEKLIKNGNYKENWHCLGRKTEKEGNNITYCVYAFNDNPRCTKDCKFYKQLHHAPWYKRLLNYIFYHF